MICHIYIYIYIGMSGRIHSAFFALLERFSDGSVHNSALIQWSDTGRKTFYIPGRCAEVWMGPEFYWSGRVRDLKFPEICILGDLGDIRRLGWWLKKIRVVAEFGKSGVNGVSGACGSIRLVFRVWLLLGRAQMNSPEVKISKKIWITSKIPEIWDSIPLYIEDT